MNSNPKSNGAVASENKICSDIGVQVLRQGGNAVDSAIAATFCIGTLNMYSSGIGGGGFMLIKMNDKTKVIDFREEAPNGSYPGMFANNSMGSKMGGLSVAVP